MTLISLGEHNYIHFDGPEMTGVSRLLCIPNQLLMDIASSNYLLS